MTRLPANLSDPTLQANLKNSDIRRNPSTDLANTGFYRALLATAPLQTLGNFPSDWSLQHLTPTAPAVEPPRRFESPTRPEPKSLAELKTLEPVRQDDEDEAPRETTTSNSRRLTKDYTPDSRNTNVILKFAPDNDFDPQQFSDIQLAPEIEVGTEVEAEIEIEFGTEIDFGTETRDFSPFLTPSNVKRLDQLAVGDSRKLVREKTSDEVVQQRETETLQAAGLPLPSHLVPVLRNGFNYDREPLDPAAEAIGLPTQPIDNQTLPSPARPSEGFPTAEDLVRRILNQTGKTDSDTNGPQASVSSEGQLKLDRGLFRAVTAEDEQANRLVQQVGRVQAPVDPNSRLRVDLPAPIEQALPNENLSAGDLAADETIEISFKPDANVLQRSGRQGPREGRRGLTRHEQGERSIGSRPGGLDPAPNVFPRPDKLPNHRLNAELPTPLSLDQIPVLPNGQKLALATGNSLTSTTANPGVTVPNIALELPGQLDDFSVALAREVGPTSASTSVPSSNPTIPLVRTNATSSDGVIKSADVEALLPVPSRVLNQVSQALKQVPAGDSTMRLQLNPVELGQLMIEISFRDGVMHGKLRAEQAPTLKMLQDGLDGLRTRLNEQGIVVQTLEVELGQQGDFSQDQQQRSFGQAQEFGQQRKSNGYFSGEGSPIRRTAQQAEAVSQPTNRNHDGRWAVNVIV